MKSLPRTSLRFRLLVSYILLVGMVAGGLMWVGEEALDELKNQALGSAKRAVAEVAGANSVAAQNLVTNYGEQLVEMTARDAAVELVLLLRGRDLNNYDKLRADPLLRAIATRQIRINGRKVGYVDVYDRNGVAVWHPNKAVEGHNYREWKERFPRMWELVEQSFHKEVVKGYYNFIDAEGRSRRKYMVLVQVKDTPFIVCASVLIDEFFTPLRQRIAIVASQVSRAVERWVGRSLCGARERVRLSVLVAAGVGMGIGIVVALVLSGAIARPIRRLEEAVVRLGQGEFDVRVPMEGGRETASLAHSFNLIGRQLATYVERVRQESAARQAVESEIRIARQIQTSLLPKTFPTREGFELYALNMAAREVAGDFYDFFYISPQRLALLIADVSGKGVPAALMMAVSRTLLRHVCMNNPDPAKALEEANRLLCQDNEQMMFVTVALGYYEPASGKLELASAGHEPPALVQRKEVVLLEPTGDIPLGVQPDWSFSVQELRLAKGQMLVMYTDGVTEAEAPTGGFYGLERMVQRLKALGAKGLGPTELCEALAQEVSQFQGGRLADDVTVMALIHGEEG